MAGEVGLLMTALAGERLGELVSAKVGCCDRMVRELVLGRGVAGGTTQVGIAMLAMGGGVQGIQADLYGHGFP